MKITINYFIFAIIAIVINIGSQDLFIRFYWGPHQIFISILVGTLVGLMVKYILDKKYIFKFQADSLGKDTRTFILYSLMGMVTTLIFWGGELGFHYLYGTRFFRYLGGGIGLAIGYWVKYYLDRRFVFKLR